jgi:serine/threonine protein kinase
VNSCEPVSTIQGVLPFIAPEVFHTRKFTQKSDVYSFGIIMYLIATGEPPFREWSFDKCLAMRVCEGLRPVMPDSAPEEFKKLAERCCNADPNKRPDAWRLESDISNLYAKVYMDKSNDNVWNTIYYNNVKPLSRLEKESKYSSTLLPTGDLPKPRNRYDLDSAAGMKTTICYK